MNTSVLDHPSASAPKKARVRPVTQDPARLSATQRTAPQRVGPGKAGAPAAGVRHTVTRRIEAPAPRPDAANASEGARPAGNQLIRVEGELRRCMTSEALWQHLANEPVALLPFGQALVFEAQTKVVSRLRWPLRGAAAAGASEAESKAGNDLRWKTTAVSGLARVNRDAPMTRWYEDIVAALWREGDAARSVCVFELPRHADAADPCTEDAVLRHLMWVPLADGGQPVRAGWLLARDQAWEESHQLLATRLAQAYAHGRSAIDGRVKPPRVWRRHQSKLAIGAAIAALALAFVHVPLTTLAPVEVTPQDPFVVAAPVPGVVERILVAPGAQVTEGTPLVQLVDTTLRSDYEVAAQKLEVARAKMLRMQQASVDDTTAKRELAIAQTEESVAQAERDYAQAMLAKSVIKAARHGVALYGDPQDWVGRPVAVGEAIMRVADPARVEFQIKVPVADAVNLHDGADVKVFLDADPLHPLNAKIVRAAYKAEADGAGVASFTVTARASSADERVERLGLRGTARVYGENVSLFYYLLRRPITAARQWTGI